MRIERFKSGIYKFNENYLYFIIPQILSKKIHKRKKLHFTIEKNSFDKNLPQKRIYKTKDGEKAIYIIIIPKSLNKFFKAGKEKEILLK